MKLLKDIRSFQRFLSKKKKKKKKKKNMTKFRRMVIADSVKIVS